MKYKDLFIDFDDTLYDTHGNSVIALQETYETYGLARCFADPQVFYDAYWQTNIDLWTQYSKGLINRFGILNNTNLQRFCLIIITIIIIFAIKLR